MFYFNKYHDPNNEACRYTLSECCCGFPDYVRLEEEEEDSEVTYDEESELTFYNHSDLSVKIIVERSQTSMDMCEILAEKFNVAKSVHLSIFEYWEDISLERPLEDDESVLRAFNNMRNFSFHARLKYRLKSNFKKYEFLQFPYQFFPPYMLDITIPIKDELLYYMKSDDLMLQHKVAMQGICPDVISRVYIQEDPKKKWKRTYMLLKDQDILISEKKRLLIKLMRTPMEQFQAAEEQLRHHPEQEQQQRCTILPEGVHVFANLSRYLVYRAADAKALQRPPTDFCIVLRPAGAPLPSMAYSTQHSKSPSGGKGGLLRCMACDSERIRSCWVLSMRLAKYGKQIRENYKAFKSRRESSQKEETKSYKLPCDDPENPRVPMDFSGGGGKIISDPEEARAVAAAEGHAWRRRLRHAHGRPPAGGAGPSRAAGHHAIDASVHLGQPWFFGSMPRERAAELIEEEGTVDGVFLVRESRSSPGNYVITYIYNYKVIHLSIQTINDHERDQLVLSIDDGATRFSDLQQLVEFYRLNRGSLPTRLTHHVSLMMTGYKSGSSSPKGEKSPPAGGSSKGLFSGSSKSLFGCVPLGGSKGD